MSKRQCAIRNSQLAILIVLLLPAIQPILTTDFTCGYDNAFHLWRSVQIARCLRQGYLYPRWAPDMAHGYGFPLFIFHPPLTAYTAAILNLLGLSWPLAINSIFVLGMLLTGVFAYIFTRDFFGPTAGLVAAVAYTYAPFLAYDVFNRGSLSESFAWAFPPLVLWAVHRWSVKEERRSLLLAAFGLAGFILTHNLFAFLFAPLLAGWVLLDSYLARDWRVVKRGVIAGLLGLGLCAFFWLPGLVERNWVQTERLLGTWVFDYRYNFLDLRQLLALPRAADPALINDWPPKALGLLPILIALLPLARWRRLDHPTRWRVALLMTCTVIFAFLTLPASRPLWDNLPLLSYIQFPWRFLGPAAFCVALLAGISASNTGRAASITPSLVILSLLILGNLGWFYPRHCAPPDDISINGMIAWERASDTLGTTAKGEYMPAWVHRMPQDTALDAAYAAGETIVRLPPESLPAGTQLVHADYGPVSAIIELETPIPFQARYLAFYYPGWRVTIDGGPVPVTPADPDGVIAFDVPAGRHTIHVHFGETPLRLTADGVSLFSLVLLIVLTVHYPHIAHRTPHTAHWSWVMGHGSFALALLILKLAILDRTDTPLRHANLVDGHLKRVDVPAEITFGDEFVLLGYDTLPERVASGAWFEVKTYWRALQPGGPKYGVTINVVDDQGYRWNGADIRSPRWHRTPPSTGEWLPSEYALVALSVPLLPGAPPGVYTIEAVAFDKETLLPLTAHDVDGRAIGPALPLGQITVTAPPHPIVPDTLGIRRRTNIALGPLTLLGADFDRDEAAPGDPILLTTFWLANEQPAEDMTVHLALLAPDGAPAAEFDLAPTVAWHPTSTWQPGDVWRGQHLLRLPARLDDGDHTWTLSLSTASQSTHLPSTIHITAPAHTFIAPPVDIEIGARLGNVATLIGANVAPISQSPTLPISPSSNLTVTLVWRAETETNVSYRVFLHLMGPNDTLAAQSDGEPASWTRPTTGWLPGEYIADVHTLAIPSDAPAGDYTLLTGLYVPGGERLTTPDGQNTILLATITVQAQ
jgi:hypothetical protein